MYGFGLVGGFLFILIQLILYVDFAFNINDAMVGKMEDGDDRDQKCWFTLLIMCTFGIYALCAVAIGTFYYYYGGKYFYRMPIYGRNKLKSKLFQRIVIIRINTKIRFLYWSRCWMWSSQIFYFVQYDYLYGHFCALYSPKSSRGYSWDYINKFFNKSSKVYRLNISGEPILWTSSSCFCFGIYFVFNLVSNGQQSQHYMQSLNYQNLEHHRWRRSDSFRP